MAYLGLKNNKAPKISEGKLAIRQAAHHWETISAELFPDRKFKALSRLLGLIDLHKGDSKFSYTLVTESAVVGRINGKTYAIAQAKLSYNAQGIVRCCIGESVIVEKLIELLDIK